MASEIIDVIVVGGGPAGLAAANTLARQLHTVLVFDSGSYRNEGARWMHTLPIWDHKSAEEFRAISRKNLLDGYQTIQFADIAVKSLSKKDDAFEVVDANGKTWQSRKLILASGVVDVYPDIEGYADCWVKGIFHCLFCHGYEERTAASAGVLAIGDLANAMPALHMARNAAQLVKKATIYTNGSEQIKADAESGMGEAKNISVDSRTIQRLEKGPNEAEVIIHFTDGDKVTEGFIAHKPKCALKSDFHEQLGLELTPQGDLKVTPPFGQTSVRGVFAAGDVASIMKIVNNALSTGAAAGAGSSAQLQADKYGQKSMF